MNSQDLKTARMKAGLSLDSLAYYLEVSPRTIRRWENGECPFGKLEQIAIEQVLRALAILGRA